MWPRRKKKSNSELRTNFNNDLNILIKDHEINKVYRLGSRNKKVKNQGQYYVRL